MNTLPGDVKRAINGTYRACQGRCSAEFSCRFNRRYQLVDLVLGLVQAARRTRLPPYFVLTVAGTAG